MGNLDFLLFHTEEVFLLKAVVFGKVGFLLITWDHIGEGGVTLERGEAGPAIGGPGRWFALRDADCQSVLEVAVLALITAVRSNAHGSER